MGKPRELSGERRERVAQISEGLECHPKYSSSDASVLHRG